MAKEFSKRGIPSVAVFSDASGEYTEDRNVAIRQLKQGKIRVIFFVGRLISLIFIFYLQSHILSAKFMDLREIKRIKGGSLLTKI